MIKTTIISIVLAYCSGCMRINGEVIHRHKVEIEGLLDFCKDLGYNENEYKECLDNLKSIIN